MASHSLSARCTALQADLIEKLDSVPNNLPVVQLFKRMLIETNVAIFSHFEVLFESYKHQHHRHLQTTTNHTSEEKVESPIVDSSSRNAQFKPIGWQEASNSGEVVSPSNEFVVPIMQRTNKRTLQTELRKNYQNKNRKIETLHEKRSERDIRAIRKSLGKQMKGLAKPFYKSPMNEAFFTPRGNIGIMDMNESQENLKKSNTTSSKQHSNGSIQLFDPYKTSLSSAHESHEAFEVSAAAAASHTKKQQESDSTEDTLSGAEGDIDITGMNGGIYFHYVLKIIQPPDPASSLPIQDFLIYKREKEGFKEDASILRRDRQFFVYNLDVKGSYKYHEFDFAKPSETLKVQWVKELTVESMKRQENWNPFSIFGSAPPAVDTAEIFPLKMYNQVAPIDRIKHPVIRFERLEMEWKRRTGAAIRLKLEDMKTAQKVYALIEQFHKEKNTYQQWIAWFSRTIEHNEWTRISARLVSMWKKEDEMDLNWKHDHLSHIEIRWLARVMNWVESKRDVVAVRQPCFCPAPNPESKWGWNDRRHALQNSAVSRMSESFWGPNLSLHRMCATFKSPANKQNFANPNPLYFKSPFKFQ